MRRIDLRLLALGCAALGLAAAAAPAFRYRAPIAIEVPAPFIELALPASAYAKAAQDGLQDLRIVDASGARVPYAQLAPRVDLASRTDTLGSVQLYALAPRSGTDTDWAVPVEVVVQGDRISVQRRPGAGAAPAGSPGWLIDLGERGVGTPAPQQLRLAWSGPAAFGASFRLETSADLRQWRAAGIGQVMALASPQGALTQPVVLLPPNVARFLRLVWFDAAAAPLLSGASAEALRRLQTLTDAPTALRFGASPEPQGKKSTRNAADAADAGALHFDLGGRLPLAQIDLQFSAGTRVAPVHVQGRDSADEAWRELGRVVFYRLEHEGEVSRSPPMEIRAMSRYLRIVPDARSAPLDVATTELLVQAPLARIVFAQQGQAPFSLLAGAADAPDGALPLATLVPGAAEVRPDFGRATLGEWTEVETVARQIESARRRAEWRPWLLWGLLIVGVLSLSAMVWRLARGSAAKS